MNPEFEAKILSRYLIKRWPTQQAVSLYADAIKKLELSTTSQETKVWDFALKHSWCIGLIDAGLAISSPNNNLRKRILIMLAILETQIEYHPFFLPMQRHRMYVLIIPYLLVKATFKMFAGKVFVWLTLRK